VPNIKSAKKRVLVAERNHLRNQAYKSAIRTSIKRVLEAIQAKGDKTELQTRLAKTYSLIDRAILKGILHKNTGARYKGRVTKAINKHTAA
jgi:small subunit ribosomal protein S20